MSDDHDYGNFAILNSLPDHFIIQIHQVERQLRSVDIKMSSGPDQIPSWILIFYVNLSVQFLMHPLVRLLYVPPIWKSANIVIIPKVYPPAEVNDLRPISLTPVLAYLLENFIFKWL